MKLQMKFPFWMQCIFWQHLGKSYSKMHSKLLGKAKFKIEVQDRAVEDVDMPPAPADMTENDFLQWVDIDNNDEVVKKKQLKNEIK